MRPSSIVFVVALPLAHLAAAAPRDDFPAERLHLSPSRTGLVDVLSGSVPEHLHFDAGLWLGYAANPLELRRNSDGSRVAALVGDRVGGSLFGSIGLLGDFEVNLELPVIAYQARAAASGVLDPPGTLAPLVVAGLGDLRLTPKYALLRDESGPFDLSVVAAISVPTGGGTNYFGDAGLTFSPGVAASKRLDALRVAANLGATLRGSSTSANLNVGSELDLRVAASWRNDGGDGPLELASSLVVASGFSSTNTTSIEWKVMGAYELTDELQLFAGAGLGVTPGWGTPDWRGFAGARFGSPRGEDTDHDRVLDNKEARPECLTQPEDRDGFEDSDGCPDPDNDQDGTLDVNERAPACLNVAGPSDNGGCPYPDTDGDGVLDKDEARPDCASAAEDKDGFEDADGCPDPDNDADGFLDAKDACPLQAEDKDGFEDTDGCADPDNDKDGTPDVNELRPACVGTPGPVENRGCPDEDRDSDGVVDRLDNCPAEAGPANNQGCPAKQKQLVAIKSGKIEILETVFFAEGKADVLAKSFPLLDNVSKVVREHPEIDHLRVDGHTDDQGKPEVNTALSEARANAVVAYLVKKGVDPARLEARGFGPSKPIADNKTKEGRAQNRRVEFNVVMPGTAPSAVETKGAP